jgi:hypothetical protein
MRCCTTSCSKQWTNKKTWHNSLTSSSWVEGNIRLMNSDVYNYSHSLLVLLPSTHTFQVYAQPNKHFATCTSFIYKQFTFRVYLTLHFHKSVTVVVSVLCVSSHKHLMCQWSKVMFYSSRPFMWPITSFTWTTPPLPLPAVEILRPWGRKIHLQCRVMMFFCGLLLIQSSKTEPPYWASVSCHITCACSSPIHPFGQPSPTCPFIMCIIKRTNARCECGSSHRAPMVLENWSIPWACASQHPSPLYTQTSDTKTPFHRHLHSLHFHFPSTLPQLSTMEPAKRVAVTPHVIKTLINHISVLIKNQFQWLIQS